jgi:hypothetical protein
MGNAYKKSFLAFLILLLLVSAAGATVNTYPKYKAWDVSGKFLVGGLLWSYQVGTSTKADTYSDAACTIPNPNPIVLNSLGEADVYISGSVKLVQETALVTGGHGSFLFTVNEASCGTLWTYSPQSAGFLYGSMIYGGTQAALQAAITAVGSDNATLRLAPGNWLITSDLVIPANIYLKPERGAVLSITTATTLTTNISREVGPYQIFSCTGTSKVVFESGSVKEVYPEWWGITGIADNVAIQAALDTKQVVRLVPLKTYSMAAGITVDVGYNSLIGGNTTLDFSSLSSGAAIGFINTNPGISGNPYIQTGNTLESIVVKGKNTNATGIKYETAAEPGVSHILINKVNVHGFGYGVYFGDNAYSIQHSNCDIWGNTVGVYTKPSTTNGGERLAFGGSTIFNNGTNLSQNNGSSSLALINCGIDYPTTQQFDLTGGMIQVIGCHIEGGAVPLLKQSINTNIDFIDCLLLQQASSGGTPYLTVGAIVNIIGGRFIAHTSTAPVVRVVTGASLTWHGAHFQYSGTNNWDLQAGSYYDIHTPFDSLHSTSRTISAPQVTSTGGKFYGGTLTTCTVANTWYNLGVATNSGLFVFRDGTSGGNAVFVADSSVGAVQIQNGIANFEMQYSCGQMQIRVTAGNTPRDIYWTLLQTNQ